MQMNGFPDSLEVPKHSAEGMTQNTGKALGQYQEQFLPAKKTPWPCSATVRMSHEFYILFFSPAQDCQMKEFQRIVL